MVLSLENPNVRSSTIHPRDGVRCQSCREPVRSGGKIPSQTRRPHHADRARQHGDERHRCRHGFHDVRRRRPGGRCGRQRLLLDRILSRCGHPWRALYFLYGGERAFGYRRNSTTPADRLAHGGADRGSFRSGDLVFTELAAGAWSRCWAFGTRAGVYPHNGAHARANAWGYALPYHPDGGREAQGVPESHRRDAAAECSRQLRLHDRRRSGSGIRSHRNGHLQPARRLGEPGDPRRRRPSGLQRREFNPRTSVRRLARPCHRAACRLSHRNHHDASHDPSRCSTLVETQIRSLGGAVPSRCVRESSFRASGRRRNNARILRRA